MELPVHLRNRLLSNSDIVALVGDRISTGPETPQDLPFPLILILRVSTTVENRLSQTSDWYESTFDISCRSANKGVTERLAKLVSIELDGNPDPVILLGGLTEDFDDDEKIHMIDVEVTIYGPSEIN